MSLACDAQIREDNISALFERYPDIAFQICYEKKIKEPCEVVDCNYPMWKEKLHLDGIDTVYIYGIDAGRPLIALIDWLHEKKDRFIIILEDDATQIDLFLDATCAKSILLDPQIHLCFAPSYKGLSKALDSCTLMVTSDRVLLIASPPYGALFPSRVSKLRLTLLRKTALISTVLTEALHYHLLASNLLSNFSKVDKACYVNRLKGVFKGIPAIICGAGPSLETVACEIKELDKSALIFACGSAIKALAAYGVNAHMGLALDPNLEEYDRLKESQSFLSALFFSSRLNARILDAIHPPLGYMSTATGGALEAHIEKKMSLDIEPLGKELSHEALSVTTMALSLAYWMGCSPIVLCGVDLSYTGMRRYADAVGIGGAVSQQELKSNLSALERLMIKKDQSGKKVYTLVKWVMEAKVLSSFAKKHKSTIFYRGTKEGLDLKAIPYRSLSELKKEHETSFDLRGKLHALMQENKILPKVSLQEIRQELLQSTGRSKQIIEQILQELELSSTKISQDDECLISARQSVFEMDLEDEVAYSLFLAQVLGAQEKILSRIYTVPDCKNSPEYKSAFLDKEMKKWQRLYKICEKLENKL